MIRRLCPTHDVELTWAETSFGFRGACPVDGCTVACWDRETSLPGDQETRDLRHRCHQLFDPLWTEGVFQSRSEAYRWMASVLGLPKHLAHIGMLTKDQCLALIVRVEAKLVKVREGSL